MVPPALPADVRPPCPPLPRQTSQYTWPQLVRLKHSVCWGGWKQRLQNTQLAMARAPAAVAATPRPRAAHARQRRGFRRRPQGGDSAPAQTPARSPAPAHQGARRSRHSHSLPEGASAEASGRASRSHRAGGPRPEPPAPLVRSPQRPVGPRGRELQSRPGGRCPVSDAGAGTAAAGSGEAAAAGAGGVRRARGGRPCLRNGGGPGGPDRAGVRWPETQRAHREGGGTRKADRTRPGRPGQARGRRLPLTCA